MHNLWGCRLARPESRKIERAEAFQLEKLENEPNQKKPNSKTGDTKIFAAALKMDEESTP